jgi:hypothetical protein
MSNIPLTKRAMIDKTNARIVVIVTIAVFVSIFSLVATKTLLSQFGYQNRVLSKKNVAVKQLEENVKNVEALKVSYDAFSGSVTNALGGVSAGTGPRDGDNAKITLDALPSYYDFPSTITSLQALVAGRGTLSSITGVDNEAQEAGNKLSSKPVPVEIPFQVTATGDYNQIQSIVDAFQKSIRPIKVNTLDIAGDNNKLTVSIAGTTYYQPGKSLVIKKEVVK